MPDDGDWVLTRNCTIDDTQEAPGNVEVAAPYKVNITATGALSVDSTNSTSSLGCHSIPPGMLFEKHPERMFRPARALACASFTNFHLLVRAGAKVLVDALATIG